MIHVTAHAVERARERCGFTTDAEARAVLTGRAIQQAALFGAKYVRLGTGQRVVLEGSCVITVLPADNYRRQIHRHEPGRFGKSTRHEETSR